MRLHRFVCPMKLKFGQTKITDRDLIHQIVKVLRLRVGERFLLSDGLGREAEVEIVSIVKGELGVSISEVKELKNEPNFFSVLYLAILKKENFDWAVQKAVESGVGKIVPIMTERTVKTKLNFERLKRIAREAVEQCGRGRVPEIAAPMSFSGALVDSKNFFIRYFFTPGQKNFWESKKGLKAGDQIALFVGPEGGWSSEELAAAARTENLEFVGLGPFVLRAETAAAISVFLAVNLLEV
jgi:16S rRNA (uracil1498-N3)-methyltransferase